MKDSMGASSLREDRAGQATPRARSGLGHSVTIPLRGAKIRLWINHAHVARILEVKRSLCVGEEVRAA